MNSQWNPCYTVNPACNPHQQTCCPTGAQPVRRLIAWDPVYTSPQPTAIVANSPPTFLNRQPVTWANNCCPPGESNECCPCPLTASGCLCRLTCCGCNCETENCACNCRTTGCQYVECELALGARSIKPVVKPASREMPDNFKMIHDVRQKYLGKSCEPKQMLMVGPNCLPAPNPACYAFANCEPPCPPPVTCMPVCPMPCQIPYQIPYQIACPRQCVTPCPPLRPVCSPVFDCAPLRHVESEEVFRDRKCM